jgi:hypothetical protein
MVCLCEIKQLSKELDGEMSETIRNHHKQAEIKTGIESQKEELVSVHKKDELPYKTQVEDGRNSK